MAPVFSKFQNKLLAAFALLVALIILPVLLFVNAAIDRASESRIEESLRTAQEVFASFLDTRRKAYSDSADILINSQPSLRALLGSSNDDEENLFGSENEESGTSAGRQETHDALFSTVEGLGIFRNAGLFLMTDARGVLLFSKADPKAFGVSLASLPIVRQGLEGKEGHTLWGSEDPAIRPQVALPKANSPTIYEVFFKPIAFGGQVKGLLAIGFPITLSEIERIRDITRSEIAFLSKGTIYGNSSAVPLPLGGLSVLNLVRFDHASEAFIGLRSVLNDSLGEPAGASLIYRSKTREAALFRRLKVVLNLIAALAMLGAVLIALPLSRGVTRSIRDLIRGAKAVRAGDLTTTVTVASADEFALLADSFNEMTRGLREKEQIKSTFRRYVSPNVLNALLADGAVPKLGGDSRRLTIYFADIAGFTRISERLKPEETIEFLNDYLSRATQCIESAGGIVDKYIGDAVMAYWLATGDSPMDREQACRAAGNHSATLLALKEKWGGRIGPEGVGVRVGIHSGQAIMGNIGCDSRMDYTLVGDDVNTAARLESLNKSYGTSILVTESVTAGLQAKFLFREVDQVRLQGKAHVVRVFELMSEREAATTGQMARAERFSGGLGLYRQREFEKARRCFGDLGRDFPEDRAALIFADRCALYATASPPAKWDGVFQMQTK